MNKIFDLAPPLLIGAAVDVVVTRENSLIARSGFTDPFHQLLILAALTILVWSGESLFQYLYGVLWRSLAQAVEHDLRIEAWRHVQDLEVAWFSQRPKGEIMSILVDDVNQLERFLDVGANDLLQIATTVVIVGTIFMVLSWPVALLAFLPIPVILWGSFRFQRKIGPKYDEMRAEVGRLNALVENDLTGIETIKSFTAEEREAERLQDASTRYREANERAIRISAAFVPLIRMAILLGFCATLLLGGWFTLQEVLSVGAYSVLVFLTQRLLWPLTRLGETFDLYQRAMSSSTRILDLIDTPIDVEDGVHVCLDEEARQSISFHKIIFGYPNRERVFEELDLTVNAGSTLGLVGPTGAGKTTLVALLLRFFDPERGRVSIGEHDVRELTLESLRRSIALVSQHTLLFPTTIEENIRYGRPDATDEDVLAAAETAEATEFIERLPKGMKTEVGEGGKKLSGGQAQRISIARAVLKDAPILILDEATSSVDNETEAALQRSLRRLQEGRTSFIIAHRLSTLRDADRIVVIDGGKIIEDGTHSELVTLKGLYADLWSVQTGS